MSDYIKREDAVERIKIDCDRFDHVPKRVVKYFTLGMESVPSADVAEVVRCKDCKYWRPDTRPEDSLDERADGLWGDGDLCVKHLPNDQLEAIEFSPDDYCKYGERKDDECE